MRGYIIHVHRNRETPCSAHSATSSRRASVNLTNGRKAGSRVELVLTSADHEPGVTLDLVRGVTVSHGLLEEGSGLRLGSRAGVKTKLGDPHGLAVVGSSLLNLSLEAVNGSLLVDVVEVNVSGVDDGVRADLVEGVEPVKSHTGSARHVLWK